jgi:glutamine amidotransferase-like uncharacterized protein
MGWLPGRDTLTRQRSVSPPLALVYRGPKAVDRLCAETTAELLEASSWGFDIDFVGPRERQPPSATALSGAAVYVQPGGGTLEKAYRRLKPWSRDIRDYVASGGRYLGFCLGGYLAGATPGFGLLPGDTDRYIDLPGASVGHDGDAIVPVLWRERSRSMYFQDGPHFLLDSQDGVQILARYTNGAVAALVAPFGRGRVAVVGPHPEATVDWFEDVDGHGGYADCRDLGQDLVDSLMRS